MPFQSGLSMKKGTPLENELSWFTGYVTVAALYGAIKNPQVPELPTVMGILSEVEALA